MTEQEPQDPVQDKLPVATHLIELRKRLFYCALGFVLAFAICFYFREDIFNFLVAPLARVWEDQPGRRLIYTALTEQFFTQIKVSFFAASFVSFPIIASQIWLFMAPGLYARERAALLPFLIATPVLFFLGGALLYYLVLPVAWNFFASFEQAGGDGILAIQLEPKVNEYLSLVMQLIFAFGLAFEVPVVLVLLVRVGIIDVDWLRHKRRYAVVLAFVAAAVLTPPDPVSQIGLALPIMLLYEASILVSAIWRQEKAEKA